MRSFVPACARDPVGGRRGRPRSRKARRRSTTTWSATTRSPTTTSGSRTACGCSASSITRSTKWFDTLKSTDFDTDPRASFMRKLMEELDAEHVNVVKAAVAANVVPVHTGDLKPGAQSRSGRIWTSVSQGAGLLQIEGCGNAEFEWKTLSGIATMLHTRTGRDLVDYLDRPAADAPPGVGALPNASDLGTQLTGYETFIVPETQRFATRASPAPPGRERTPPTSRCHRSTRRAPARPATRSSPPRRPSPRTIRSSSTPWSTTPLCWTTSPASRSTRVRPPRNTSSVPARATRW